MQLLLSCIASTCGVAGLGLESQLLAAAQAARAKVAAEEFDTLQQAGMIFGGSYFWDLGFDSFTRLPVYTRNYQKL